LTVRDILATFGGRVSVTLVDPPTGECISEFLCSGRCAVELKSKEYEK